MKSPFYLFKILARFLRGSQTLKIACSLTMTSVNFLKEMLSLELFHLFVFKCLLLFWFQDIAAQILKRYYHLVDTKWTDNAVFLEHFKQECKDICSDSNFQLAVIQLQRDKLAYVFEEYGEKVGLKCFITS